MRPAANMSKDSLALKRKALVEVTLVQSDQDDQTNAGLVFKRKRRETTSPLGNTPTQMAELHTRRSLPSKSVRPKAHAEKAYGMLTSTSLLMARLSSYPTKTKIG